jgi:hypothetical protein
MRRFVLAAILAGFAFGAWALPTVDDVQAEVARGNYVHAEDMMRDVIAAKPGSARAHYVYAEILAHNKRFTMAAEQAARAKSIDPTLKFTQPEKFQAFEQVLEREQAAERRPVAAERAIAPTMREPAPVERGSGVPGWVWGLGLVAVGVVAWRAFSARRQAAAPASVPAYAATSAPGTMAAGTPMGGYGPGYAPAASAGSGLLGTGLAVAGGVAAGMLAEKLLSGRQQSNAGQLFPEASRGLGSSPLEDSIGDSAAARELEERPVDFGNGDGWGGGDAGGGDAGGSDGGWD